MKPSSELILLARSLGKVRWICPGSLVKQYQLKRGTHRVRRYGPYLIWTRKVNNKTVTIALSAPQARLVSQAIANRKRLEKILNQMQRLTTQAVLQCAAPS